MRHINDVISEMSAGEIVSVYLPTTEKYKNVSAYSGPDSEIERVSMSRVDGGWADAVAQYICDGVESVRSLGRDVDDLDRIRLIKSSDGGLYRV